MPLKCSLVLAFSLTINVSVGMYFFIVPLAKFMLSKSQTQMAYRMLKLLRERPSLVRKICRDQIFTVLLFICGIVLLVSSDVLQNPIRNTSPTVLTAFAIELGHYIYKCHQDFLLRREIPFFKINLLHHIVAASTYTVFILFEQNAISGIIGLLFEGSVAVLDFKCLLPLLGVKKNSLLYVCTAFASFVACVILRAVCPVVILGMAILKYNPLTMDYLPLGFFFMNIVFFTMINGWLVKSGFDSLRRRWRSRRLLQYLEREIPTNNLAGNADEQEEGLEMNNFSSSVTVPRNVLPVIIPSDDSFRLATPVSNVNMTCENAQISNISLSRRERTVPNISVIIDDAGNGSASSFGDHGTRVDSV